MTAAVADFFDFLFESDDVVPLPSCLEVLLCESCWLDRLLETTGALRFNEDDGVVTGFFVDVVAGAPEAILEEAAVPEAAETLSADDVRLAALYEEVGDGTSTEEPRLIVELVSSSALSS